LNQFTPNDIDCHHSALVMQVDSIIRKRSNSICHFHCLDDHYFQQSAFSVCDVIISSRASTVRCVMCSHVGWRHL